ncbi:hypothetical protein SAMN05216210_0365 [Halopseudomonas salegens]|uniref:Uncharacterized protein n=1 Tax=Halopseudomonas salegens TaxID=1434072 RepID=A0A1H2E5Z0_9GAMM|nr:hypothetical protein SAMN05216210_0365 [Halopseudomonas salegens]
MPYSILVAFGVSPGIIKMVLLVRLLGQCCAFGPISSITRQCIEHCLKPFLKGVNHES